jgi:hypothetical protein
MAWGRSLNQGGQLLPARGSNKSVSKCLGRKRIIVDLLKIVKLLIIHTVK